MMRLRSPLRPSFVLVSASSLVSSLALIGCGGGAQKKVFAEYEQAIQSGDVSAALACVTDDWKLTDQSSGRTIDRKQMQWNLEWDAAMNREIEYTEKRFRSDGLHTIVVEDNDYCKALGMKPRTYRVRVRFDPRRDHGIAEMIVEENLSGGPSEREALMPFVNWARAQRKAELDAIYPKDTSATAVESAGRWKKLLGEWPEQMAMTSVRVGPRKFQPGMERPQRAGQKPPMQMEPSKAQPRPPTERPRP